MSNIIKIKRGLKADLPTLEIGEMGYCTDTNELFIGTATGNELINEDTDISQLSNIGDVQFTSLATGDVLTFDGTNWVNDEPAAGNSLEIIESTETITVGSGGDFSTINEALAHITKKYPVYVSATVRPRVTINLLTGFVMTEQVIVDGLNLSWITISSVDNEVVIQRSALTTAIDNDNFPAFTAKNGGFTPIINVLFNMDASGTAQRRHGLMAFNNSRAIILENKGFKNVGGRGINATNGSIISANIVNVSGSGDMGMFAGRGSTINARASDASNATFFGIFATENSRINAESTNASGSGFRGVSSSKGSIIHAQSVNGQVGESPGNNDFFVTQGGILQARATTGGTSQTINTLTREGIIFK